jgi:hypothetical protein
MKRFLGLTLLATAMLMGTLTAQDKKDPPTENKQEAPKEGATDATQVTAAPVPDDYYPLKKDATWTYEVAGGEITVKCVGHDKIGDVDCFKLETTANGKVSATEHVKIDKDGIYRYAVNGIKPDAPIRFLALPADAKTNWSVDTKVQGQDVKGSFTIKKEEVTVPSGTYKDATLVESSGLKIGGMETSIKQWFAPGVGIVKLDFKLGGQDAELKLKKFEPGK